MTVNRYRLFSKKNVTKWVKKFSDVYNGLEENSINAYRYEGPMYRFVNLTEKEEIMKAIYKTGILKQNHIPEFDKEGKEIKYNPPLEQYIKWNEKSSYCSSGCGNIEDLAPFILGPKEGESTIPTGGKSKKQLLIQEALTEYKQAYQEGSNVDFSTIIEAKKLNDEHLFLKDGAILCLATNEGTTSVRWNANKALEIIDGISNSNHFENEIIGVGQQNAFFVAAISTRDIGNIVLNLPVDCIVSGNKIIDLKTLLEQKVDQDTISSRVGFQ